MLTWRLTLWFLMALTIIHEGFSRKPKWLRFGKSYFALMESQKTWAEAVRKCDEMGGHLAEIDDWKEALFIKTIVKDRNLNPPFVWLGGHDLLLEDHWKWEKSNQIISYTDWCQWEPNNLGSGENCLAMTGKCDWKWYDEPCTIAYNFICEYNRYPWKTLVG